MTARVPLAEAGVAADGGWCPGDAGMGGDVCAGASRRRRPLASWRAHARGGRPGRLAMGGAAWRLAPACRSCVAMFAGASCSRARTRRPSTPTPHSCAQVPTGPSLGTLQTRAEEAMDATVPFDERLAFFADRDAAHPAGPDPLRRGPDRRRPARRGGRRCLRQAWIEDDFGEAEEQLFLDRFGADLRPDAHVGAARPAALGRADRSGAAHAAAGRPAQSGPRRPHG